MRSCLNDEFKTIWQTECELSKDTLLLFSFLHISNKVFPFSRAAFERIIPHVCYDPEEVKHTHESKTFFSFFILFHSFPESHTWNHTKENVIQSGAQLFFLEDYTDSEKYVSPLERIGFLQKKEKIIVFDFIWVLLKGKHNMLTLITYKHSQRCRKLWSMIQ